MSNVLSCTHCKSPFVYSMSTFGKFRNYLEKGGEENATVRQPGIKACTIRQLGITRTTASQSEINDKHSYTDSRVSKQPQLHSLE